MPPDPTKQNANLAKSLGWAVYSLEGIFPLESVTKINPNQVGKGVVINWSFSSLWSVVGPLWSGNGPLRKILAMLLIETNEEESPHCLLAQTGSF